MGKELLLFAKSLGLGIIMMIGYDMLRIIRRVIRHSAWFVAVEDLAYWIGSGIFLFAGIYRENSGILRGYIFIGIVFGMMLWHFTLGEYLVRSISGGIRSVLKRLKLLLVRCKIILCKQRFFRKS